jgi:hypothetical protein
MSTTSTASRGPDVRALLPRPGAATAADRPVDADPPGPAAGYRYDVRTGHWEWSSGVFALYGVEPGPHRPGTELLLTHTDPADRPRLQRALADACTTGVGVALEHRVVRPDGDVRTAVLVAEPERADDGTLIGLSGLLIDVTEGRLPPTGDAEEQLRTLTTEIEQLRTAMASRAAIEQAKGILMLLTSCGDQVAFDLLAHISSHTHRKVRDVALSIVASASGGTPLPDDVRAILRDACPPGGAPD